MAAPEGYKALAKIGITYKYGYVSGTAYSQLDAVYYEGSTYLALIDSPAGGPRDDGVNWKYLAKGFPSDINDVALSFEEAESRENIASGENVKTVFGKIKKWFADLTAPAFAQMISSAADVKSNTVSGYIPDALAVKELYEEQNSNLVDSVMIVTVQFPNSVSLVANAANYLSMTLDEIAGYKPVEFTVALTGGVGIVPYGQQLNPNTRLVRIDAMNLGTNTVTMQPTIRVLYVKEELVK